MIISSQRYINESIIAEKVAGEDFEVMLSPSFEIDGETYQVILDGHHSFQAAKLAGVAPTFWVADCGDHDAIGILENGTPDDFLLAVHMDSDYYNAETGKDIW